MFKNQKGIGLIPLILIIILVLVIGATAIVLIINKDNTNANKESEIELSNQNNTINITTEKDNNSKDVQETEDIYDNFLVAFERDIYVSYKNGLRNYSLGTKAKGVGSNYNFILFAYETEKEYKGTLNEVFDYFNSSEYNFLSHIRSKGEARFMSDSGSLLKEQEQNTKINGIDMIKFTGKAIDEDKEEFKVFGYTFIIDNIPGMLVGFDFSNENVDSLIEDVEKEVDIMIKTLRTDR